MKNEITTRLIDGADPHLELDGAELKVIAGPDRGLTVSLGVESLTIGTGSSCNLVLHDPTVSARHAEVYATERGYFIHDLGSRNRVRYGDVPIERAGLVGGMRLCLGSTVLQVRATGSRQTIALGPAGRFSSLVAHSLKMRALVAALEKVASTESTVLIEGETGTGKEVTAQAIHEHSARKKGPLVVFDCGAINRSLASAELFGFEQGAFTGADRAREGLFEQAEGGTLFLDEVGELPLELQPMLLGALERKMSRRIGGRQEIPHDVRVLAATNRNLLEEVRSKRFREDLYFRLAVVKLRLPPLRERIEDLPHLASQFASELGAKLSSETLVYFMSYPWPGNLRELKNAVARQAAQPGAPTEDLLREHVAAQLLPLREARRNAADEFERQYLARALAQSNGSVSRAAELAGVSRRFLSLLAAKHGMRVRDREGGEADAE